MHLFINVMYVFMYMYIYVIVSVSVFELVCMYVCMYVCMHASARECVWVNVFLRTEVVCGGIVVAAVLRSAGQVCSFLQLAGSFQLSMYV